MSVNYRVRIAISRDGRQAELFEDAYPSASLIRGRLRHGKPANVVVVMSVLGLIEDQLLPSVIDTLSAALGERYAMDAALDVALATERDALAQRLAADPSCCAVLSRLTQPEYEAPDLEQAWQDTRLLVDLTRQVLEGIKRVLSSHQGLRDRAAAIIVGNISRRHDCADPMAMQPEAEARWKKIGAQRIETVGEAGDDPSYVPKRCPLTSQEQQLIDRLRRRVLADFWQRSLATGEPEDPSSYAETARERRLRTLPIAEPASADVQADARIPLARVRLVGDTHIGMPEASLCDDPVGVRWLQVDVRVPVRSGPQSSPEAQRALMAATVLRLYLLASLMLQRRRIEHALDRHLAEQDQALAHQVSGRADGAGAVFAEHLPRFLMGETAGKFVFPALVLLGLTAWLLMLASPLRESSGGAWLGLAVMLGGLTGLLLLWKREPGKRLPAALAWLECAAAAVMAASLSGVALWFVQSILTRPDAVRDVFDAVLLPLVTASAVIFVLMVTLRTRRNDHDMQAFAAYQDVVQSLAQELSEVNLNVASQTLWLQTPLQTRFEKYTSAKAPEQFLRQLDALIAAKEAVVSVERVLQTHKTYSSHTFQDIEARRSAARRKLLAVGSGLISGYFTFEAGSAVMDYRDLLDREDPVGLSLNFMTSVAPGVLRAPELSCQVPTDATPIACHVPGLADVGGSLGITCPQQCLAVQQAYQGYLDDWHQGELIEMSLLLCLTFVVSLLVGWISASLSSD